MQVVQGKVIEGLRAASGLREPTDSQRKYYPEGTIKTQHPFFKERGLDLKEAFAGAGGVFWGTLNIEPNHKGVLLAIDDPTHHLRDVEWVPGLSQSRENFSLQQAWLCAGDKKIEGLLYYPNQETRPGSTQGRSHIEWIGPLVEDVDYGSEVELHIQEGHLVFDR